MNNERGSTLNFNIVEYTQNTYRRLLDSMARPGKLNQIEGIEYENIGDFTNFTLGIAQTLLDQEVSYCILNSDKKMEKDIKILTMSNMSHIREADYLFINRYEKIKFDHLKKGNLAYPDESTTIIHEVEEMKTQKLEQSVKLELSGPGIKEKSYIYIKGLDTETIDNWIQCNREYPLGVDFIFVDRMGNICGIPRSTKLKWEVS